MKRLAIVIALVAACGGDDDVVEPDATVGLVKIVPDETADEDALADLADWRRLPVLGSASYAMQSSVD